VTSDQADDKGGVVTPAIGSRPTITLIFDLDGTLIDSINDLAISVTELVVGLGGRPLDLDEVAAMVGEGASILIRRALTAGGLDPETPDALSRFLSIYDRRLLETTSTYEGIEASLQLLSRRARMAVLTNKPLAPAQRILDALGLTPFFSAVVGGDGPLGRKPDPRGLLSLAPGGPALLIGDSPVDAETAAAASCGFVWARYGFGASRFDAGPPDTPWVLERPSDLPAVVDRFAAIAGGS
jgi:phosphoglycolate phosphatase